MSRVKIGKAKYGNTQKKFWKLKDGESVFGILPPLGDLAADGKWSIYYRVHYGYKNSEGKSRPFQSCLVKNRKPPHMVEVPDAAVERLDMLKGQLQAAKDTGNEKAKEALFKLVGGQKSLYNLDNNHYLNAIDLQGNIGILKLRHKAKLALDAEIAKLRKKNVDPLGVENRRFFVFTRTGTGNETSFKVDVYKEKITVENVGEVERELIYTLPDDVLDRLGTEAAKLDKIFKSPTAEEVAQIVKESSLATGVSPNIDKILGITSGGSASVDTEETDEPDSDEVAETAPAQAAKPATAAPAPTPTPTASQSQPAVQSAPAPTPAPEKKAAPAPVPKPAALPPTTKEKLAEMSDSEFLASLGIPQ